MKAQTFLFLLFVGLAVYLVSQGPTELFETVGISPTEEVLTESESGEDTVVTEEGGDGDVMSYVRLHIGHTCRTLKGNTISCMVKNRGPRELAGVTLEINASAGGESEQEIFILEADGPFPAKSERKIKLQIPGYETIQWLSNQSTIIDARFP